MKKRTKSAATRKQVSNANAKSQTKASKSKCKGARRTNKEVQESVTQLEKHRSEVNRVLEQELRAYVETRLEKEHFAGIWASSDCHGEEQKTETVFLAKVVTARTRLKFPLLKDFKFTSQVRWFGFGT